jgi:hypothetical protein
MGVLEVSSTYVSKVGSRAQSCEVESS